MPIKPKKVAVSKKETTSKKPRKTAAKKPTKKVGRPSVMNETVVKKILEVLKDGGSVEKACMEAKITKQTFYNHCNDNPEFLDEVEYAKNWVNEIARGQIIKSIIEWNTQDAKWWLERRDKENFSTRSELTGKDGENITAVNFVITPINKQ